MILFLERRLGVQRSSRLRAMPASRLPYILNQTRQVLLTPAAGTFTANDRYDPGNFWAVVAQLRIRRAAGGIFLSAGGTVSGLAAADFPGGGFAAGFVMRNRLRLRAARLEDDSAFRGRRKRAGVCGVYSADAGRYFCAFCFGTPLARGGRGPDRDGLRPGRRVEYSLAAQKSVRRT